MKILVVIGTYKPAYIYGGPIRALTALGEALTKQGNEITVLTTNANGPTDLDVPLRTRVPTDGVDVYYFRRWTGDHSSFTPGLLLAFWRQCKKADVVHLHAWWNLVTMPVMLMCVLKNIKPVLSPRGSITPYSIQHQKTSLKQVFHRVIGKRLLEKAVIHVTAPQELSDCTSIFTPMVSYIIPNIHQLHDKLPDNARDTSRLRLLYLGRIDRKKNIEFLIDVLGADFEVPYSLAIIGDGDMTYIESLKKKTEGMIAITWHDPIHSEDKWQRMADADVFVLPSLNENYANVVIEALSQGTSVMLSDQVGLKDYVSTNNFGWVLPCETEQWRSQLRGIWQNPTQLRRIREEAPGAIRRDFNTDKLTHDYQTMYDEVYAMQAR